MVMRSWLPVVALAVSACSDPSPNASGVLHASGDPLGTWDFTPDPSSCKNGLDKFFTGVDLSDGTRAVRFLDDPAHGYTLVIATGGDISIPAVVYHVADCTQFEATIAVDPDDDNGDGQSGGFAVTCPAPPGAMAGGVTGAISFAHCDHDSQD